MSPRKWLTRSTWTCFTYKVLLWRPPTRWSRSERVWVATCCCCTWHVLGSWEKTAQAANCSPSLLLSFPTVHALNQRVSQNMQASHGSLWSTWWGLAKCRVATARASMIQWSMVQADLVKRICDMLSFKPLEERALAGNAWRSLLSLELRRKGLIWLGALQIMWAFRSTTCPQSLHMSSTRTAQFFAWTRSNGLTTLWGGEEPRRNAFCGWQEEWRQLQKVWSLQHNPLWFRSTYICLNINIYI